MSVRLPMGVGRWIAGRWLADDGSRLFCFSIPSLGLDGSTAGRVGGCIFCPDIGSPFGGDRREVEADVGTEESILKRGKDSGIGRVASVLILL